ncbi:Glycosyltransferases OS=Pelotomaculum thermopropionicum (strain DSM 13744 / JCM 10971 / SI) GN=WcaA PE=4 SV=1: Glycos_transf_2 [Gemmataceae bacterium]|nr:Glycosyltransferases OS=Pelotomaculum thermopropionicum (strain DSM 13744 / JCM 10971 / SI) GN=WcaA PE=4 SV=1: Glycos_transf_2 [Gemmataceae bacterium]VTU01984.1 Glycosyltransferases OS=Pelotomaculum thermopropionicum (strain DSM 13744 / JCM 10971 / SI) GN=WcaA PE=4 SV=1: Glycos_transf_2 [Gemmataceae bacterium]
MTKTNDAVTVVIPVHNAADRLDRVTSWRLALEKLNRTHELLVVDDGSTDGTADRLASKEPRARVLRHDARRGFGACLRTALAEAKHPLFFYTALDYPYSPHDLRPFFERIELRDEVLGKQPDLISGCRTGLPTPLLPKVVSLAWRGFWRVFAGMPMQPPAPWHGWAEFWYGARASWVFGVPLNDVNSCFKLYRTAFLRRFPIQSDGDFVHVELVAKATFLTSIMDEQPLTAKPDPVPPLGDTAADRRRLFRHPDFCFPPVAPQAEPPVADAPGSPEPAPQPAT